VDELTLLKRIAQRSADLIGVFDRVIVGPGDDCAIVRSPRGDDLLLTTDQLIEGQHFTPETSLDLIARKAIARSISDLAAMAGSPLCSLVAAALAWASTSICQYRFGVEDQAQYLVQLQALEHPGTFTNDPYLDSFTSLGSVFWHGIAAISSPKSLPTIVLSIHLALTGIFAITLAWAVWPALPRLAGRGPLRGIGTALIAMIPALLLVVPKEQNWFGLVSLSDRELTATFAVLPLVALDIGLVIRQRLWLALLIAALAAPIQDRKSVV